MALLTILFHLVVTTIHGQAHRKLHIGLSPLQTIFVLTVIFAFPLIAALLLITGKTRAGAWILAISMTASMIFGVWNHYIVMSPDNVAEVAYLANRYWAMAFEVSALMIALTEVLAAAIGVRLWLSPK